MSTVIKVTGAQSRKIIAREGDDFSLVIAVKAADGSDYDFTGHSAKMQVKRRKVETDEAVISFTIGDGIILTTGHINFSKSAAAMQSKSGNYFYDLKIIDPDGVVNTWLYGDFELQPTVTA